MTALEFNSRLGTMYGSLELFTRKFTKDPDEAADLIQETLFKAFKYKDKFRHDTNLKAWLFTIMKNTFINNYRKLSKLSYTSGNEKETFPVAVKDSSFEAAPEDMLNYDELLSTVKKIKPEFRIPFEMHYNGYKYHEIAEKINIPLGTVKTRIFYARKELQKLLA